MPKDFIKKVLSFLNNKKVFFVFLFFIFLICFLPTNTSAQGDFLSGFGSGISNAGSALINPLTPIGTAVGTAIGANDPTNIVSKVASEAWDIGLSTGLALLGLLFYFIAAITAMFADLTAGLLRAVLDPNFTGLSYTNPANNPIIETGLNVTQSFVNMILVVVLVWIAVATILRLSEYQTRKILITFIIVALLVNFAPVICGVAVDASNITMNFFIKGMPDTIGQTFLFTRFEETLKKLVGVWEGYFKSVSVTKEGGGLAQSSGALLVMAITYFFAGLAYLLFSLVFILRHMVIWLLVILSPIAFALYVLPNTRGFFKQWRDQFIAWSVIGITAGFFLYLAETLAAKSDQFVFDASIMGGIMGLFVPTLFIIVGLFFGLQTSAIGAKSLIGIVQRGEKWVGKRVGSRAWKGSRSWLEENARIPFTQVRPRDAVGWAAKHVAGARVARWFLPEEVKAYGEYRPAIEKAQKEAVTYSSLVNTDDIMSGAVVGTDAAGRLLETIKRGDGQDIFHAGRRKFGKNPETEEDYTDDELLEHKGFQNTLEGPLRAMFKAGLGTTLRSDPRLAAIAAGKKWSIGYSKLNQKDAIKKAVEEARASHITNWEPEVLKNKDVIEFTMGKFDRQRWLQINNQVKGGQDVALEGMDKAFTKFVNKHGHQNLDADPEKNHEEQIKKYKEYIKKETGEARYFTALENKIFRDTGWRTPKYTGSTPPPSPSPTPTPPHTPPPSPSPTPTPPHTPPASSLGITKSPKGRPGASSKPKVSPKGRRSKRK